MTPVADDHRGVVTGGFEERTTVELAVLAGYDADLATESTRLMNRLHGALLHVHPALERLLGKHFRRRGVLRLVAATGTLAALAALGPTKIKRLIANGSPRIAATLPAEIISSLAEQTMTIPATEQYGQVIRGLATQLLSVFEQRDVLAADLESLLGTHPLAEILTSMPGVGSRTAIELLRTVGDGSTFRALATSRPTPAWPRPPANLDAPSRANTNHDAATDHYAAPCTSRPSPA